MKKATVVLACILLALQIIGCRGPNEKGWELISGSPPYADPSPIVYDSDIELEGWIEYEAYYVGEEVPHFHLSEQSLNKMPDHIKNRETYVLVDAETREWIEGSYIQTLEAYSQISPATVRVTGLEIRIEGSPLLFINQ